MHTYSGMYDLTAGASIPLPAFPFVCTTVSQDQSHGGVSGAAVAPGVDTTTTAVTRSQLRAGHWKLLYSMED